MITSRKVEQQEYFVILTSYVKKQRFPDSEAALCNLYGVLDGIYQPLPEFWAGLKPETLIQAFVSQVPTLRADEIFDWGASFHDEAELQLYMRQFDERCAMRILSLPVSERPSGREQTYEWLMTDFQSKGEFEYAEYLEVDGYKGARAVLEFMAGLEAGAILLPS
jgi:hypothetical protein